MNDDFNSQNGSFNANQTSQNMYTGPRGNQQNFQGNPYVQPQGPVNYGQPYIPEEYKPISMWGYFGYEILFSIPIVGFVLLIIFAITASNKNLKNFARSYFCFMIIAFVIVMIIMATGGAASLFDSYY